MILKIKSPNRHLLDLLFKNPATDNGLYFKALRNGIIAGNAVSAQEYEVVFQDTQNSYLPEESNRIDFQSYCSPLAVLNICTELFAHILKDKTEFRAQDIAWLNLRQGDVDNEPCTIQIPTFYIHSSWYRDGEFLLSKYFEGVSVTHQQGKNFSLKITAPTVFEAFNLLNLVALFTHMTNEYGMFTYIDDSFAAKYVRVLTNIGNVPYFIFYLYIKRAVKSNKQFLMIKPIIEQYLAARGLEADLTFFGTQQDRQHFITGRLDLQTAILDIGCGELSYYKRMMNLGLKANYYAIDEDLRFEKLAEMIAYRYEAENLFFFQNLENFSSAEKVNIIMSEVIEHNTLETARELICKALDCNFNQIIITTPNADFNQYYFNHDAMRHDDHHFELSHIAFKDLIRACVSGRDHEIKMDFQEIGDKLNGIQPTQACILKKNQ